MYPLRSLNVPLGVHVPQFGNPWLKPLSQLEKCCVSLKNIEQVSSLDSMHVIMGVVNKLPINLKRAWVEMRYKLNNKLVRERSFLICLNLLQKKAELLILFLVEKRFKLITNLAAKARMFLQRQKM